MYHRIFHVLQMLCKHKALSGKHTNNKLITFIVNLGQIKPGKATKWSDQAASLPKRAWNRKMKNKFLNINIGKPKLGNFNLTKRKKLLKIMINLLLTYVKSK